MTQKVYDHWRRKNGRDTRSVREITDGELQEIYRFQYWDLVHGDRLPPGVDLAVFDFAVHSGPTRAVRTLQKVMGLRQDGDLGAVTVDSLLDHDPVEIVERLCAARLAFMKSLATWKTFGKGWNRRVVAIRSACISMAGGDSTEFPRLAGLGIMGDGMGEEDEGDQGSARASADPRDFAVMSTTAGRGAVTAGLGTAGAALTEAADSISFVSEHSEIIKAVSSPC